MATKRTSAPTSGRPVKSVTMPLIVVGCAPVVAPLCAARLVAKRATSAIRHRTPIPASLSLEVGKSRCGLYIAM